jgi:undecaprenyl-diphosphatase
MTFFDAVILGILQGLTEFLPVSSSGHLVLAQSLLGVSDYGVSFEVIVHLGTVLSVFVYFRSTILRLIQSLFRPAMVEERKLIVFLIIGTIPAGVIGVLFEDFFEQTFSEPLLTSFFLLVTGTILVVSRFFKNGVKPVGAGSSLIMGFGQALAIFPGISRSGSTIVAGMIAGVEPAKAAEFSFLLVIPAILGATVLKVKNLAQLDAAMAGHYIVGAACAFITGLIAVYAVLAVIRRGRFEYFGYYCFAAGLFGLYLFW